MNSLHERRRVLIILIEEKPRRQKQKAPTLKRYALELSLIMKLISELKWKIGEVDGEKKNRCSHPKGIYRSVYDFYES